MGATDTKQISSQIDAQFKSLRKYHDSFYGQITLVQNKSTQKLYALVEKIMLNSDSSFSQFLVQRKLPSPHLVRLHQYYSCSVDYCSGLEKYFFLLEYTERTLYEELADRQEKRERWSVDELWNIIGSFVELLEVLRDRKSAVFRNFISNHFIMYESPQSLKTLQSSLKVENDAFQQDFHVIKHSDAPKHLYLAPQAYTLMCNKQKFQAKAISLTQKSIIFMLGMNILQCALLADVSGIYNTHKRCVQIQMLQKALEGLSYLYGQEIFHLVESMLAKNPDERLFVQEIKEYIRANTKRRKITIPKHTKLQSLKQKQLRV